MSLGYAAAGKPALLDSGSVASKVGWPRAHLVFADATIAFAPVRRQPLDEPGAGLLRRDHRLHAEGAGKCVGRGVAAQFGLQAVEVLGVVLAADAVEHADADLGVHEADIGAGPCSHRVAVAPAAHVDVGLPVA